MVFEHFTISTFHHNSAFSDVNVIVTALKVSPIPATNWSSRSPKGGWLGGKGPGQSTPLARSSVFKLLSRTDWQAAKNQLLRERERERECERGLPCAAGYDDLLSHPASSSRAPSLSASVSIDPSVATVVVFCSLRLVPVPKIS